MSCLDPLEDEMMYLKGLSYQINEIVLYSHPREIIEMALAHSTHSATEAAYARGDMLLKRRRLMEDWAQFLTVPEREIEDLIEIRADRKEWL